MDDGLRPTCGRRRQDDVARGLDRMEAALKGYLSFSPFRLY
ncbi:hypothetical protein ACP70R_022375 [Stipagrostis hirtigluma subsp. patula]